MRAVGITCGIGSMLVGARQAGFEIAGNVEWRRYYHATDELGRNTFAENFPGAAFPYSLDGMGDRELERFFGADLALGHPECGNFSTLSAPNLKMGHDHRMDAADIPLFVDIVARLRPRFFVMDDLPRSLVPFPMKEYAARLPDYDLFPEWVSNWGYGNVQRGRKRFFMIGALREERWAFRAGEEDHDGTVVACLGDLQVHPDRTTNVPDHQPHNDGGRSTLFVSDKMRDLILSGTTVEQLQELGDRGELDLADRRTASWAEVGEIVRAMPEGGTVPYLAADGTVKLKIGFFRPRWEGHSYVLTGGPNSSLHPVRCTPYTVRERARIQGFPDDFMFYGTKLNPDGTWDILRNVHMIKQTGKAMPVQFCTYASRQVAAHLRGEDFSASGQRLLSGNEHVDRAKFWFCETRGYADQERACAACWLYDRCTIRARRYQIGEPAVGQRDLIDPGVVPVPAPKKKKVSEPPRPRPAGPQRVAPEPKTIKFGGW